MAIATTFRQYLEQEHIQYDTMTHGRTHSSLETARSARVPVSKLAKAVVFRDENDQYLMAVLPSQCRAEPSSLSSITHHNLELAGEKELARLFSDCELGAIPPAGNAYAIPMVWDELLEKEDDLYVECGDHEHLLHMTRDQFSKLMGSCNHGRFSRPR